VTPERYQRVSQMLDQRQPDLTLVLEDVHKPHNLAAIARSCDAVGIGEIHAVASDESIRLKQTAAAGVSDWIEVHRHSDIALCIDRLKRSGFQLLAAHLSADEVSYLDVDYTKPTALISGTELFGISDAAAELVDAHVVIPMHGMVQSLNVSVATALILFEARRQRQAAGLYDRCRIDAEHRARLLFRGCHSQVAAYCDRKRLPYPAIDEAGEIIGPIAEIGAAIACELEAEGAGTEA
jgi:tRNA (guanosine-2'-O-)-methyltransferase